MNLYYELTNDGSPGPLPAYLDMSDGDIIRLLQRQIAIGVWRSDLEAGLTFCSAEACRLFGLPETEGPIDFGIASKAIHPEDHDLALELIETSVREKGSYLFVMRVASGDAGQYRFVRVIGRYRDKANGGGEIIGICHEIPAAE
ncbi:PAS domain-containing protein [Rhizobium sp. C1]|uniref:PAS domain-containing protein n=1 Tax=Rhizobium sp. C1 TaxID=1349799 RepID=UPI001E2A93CE|nr:PAS domain-containing protein [Rhizobium sp. C1]MCD2180365.1 PAS domain-containing protein [Rhizobium sp. C1]